MTQVTLSDLFHAFAKATGRATDNEPEPPAARRSDTSVAAAKSVRTCTAKLRAKVRDAIAAKGDHGATCDEIEVATGLSHQTASARVHELAKLGGIEDSGRRRPTRSGRKAAVYRARG